MGDLDTDPVVERALSAFNDHDLDRLMDEFAEGGTFTDPLVEGEATGTEIREYTAEVFEAFPDVRLEVDRVVASGDGAVAIEGVYAGTHEGPIEGIPPTGNRAVVPTVTVIDVSEDGITAWRDYWDQRTFSEELGLVFPDVVPKVPGIAAAKVRDLVR
jgi:steroid delta-isomerase-like uncharacterized protein